MKGQQFGGPGFESSESAGGGDVSECRKRNAERHAVLLARSASVRLCVGFFAPSISLASPMHGHVPSLFLDSFALYLPNTSSQR